MKAEQFVTWQTLLIMGLGLLGFVFDTVGGVLFAKALNLFSKKKVNPMIGAAGAFGRHGSGNDGYENGKEDPGCLRHRTRGVLHADQPLRLGSDGPDHRRLDDGHQRLRPCSAQALPASCSRSCCSLALGP